MKTGLDTHWEQRRIKASTLEGSRWNTQPRPHSLKAVVQGSQRGRYNKRWKKWEMKKRKCQESNLGKKEKGACVRGSCNQRAKSSEVAREGDWDRGRSLQHCWIPVEIIQREPRCGFQNNNVGRFWLREIEANNSIFKCGFVFNS